MYPKVKYKLINLRCTPEKMDKKDAAYDLKCGEKHVRINPGQRAIVSLGVAFKIPTGVCGILTHRSSLAFKKGCTLSYGLIDSSFDSEVKACVFNHSDDPVTFHEGDRIAQIRFTNEHPILLSFEGYPEEGKKGFGSSGGYSE